MFLADLKKNTKTNPKKNLDNQEGKANFHEEKNGSRMNDFESCNAEDEKIGLCVCVEEETPSLHYQTSALCACLEQNRIICWQTVFGKIEI